MNRAWVAFGWTLLGCNLDAGKKPPPVEASNPAARPDHVDEQPADEDGGSQTPQRPGESPTSTTSRDSGGPSQEPNTPPGGDAGLATAQGDASLVTPGVDLDEVDPVLVPSPEAAAPVCGVGAQWSSLRGLSEAKDVRATHLLSVTPDGKSWVFAVNKPEASPASDASVQVSDAGTNLDAAPPPDASAFDYYLLDLPGAPVPLLLPKALNPSRGAALSPDALRLVVVEQVPSSLSELRRDRRGDEFGSPSEAPFTRLRGAALQTGYAYENPTFSASGNSLYVSSRVRDVHQIRQLSLNDGRWDTAWLMNDLQLLLDDPWRVSLSSASSDDRTVFLWDSVGQRALVADRSEFGEPTGEVESMNIGSPVFVNDDCTRLFTLNDEGVPAFADRQ